MDVLVLNAGVGQATYVAQNENPSALKAIMDINFFGSMNPTIYALPYLEQSKGRIAVVSSVLGYVPLMTSAAYCASKFALEGFFRSLRIELAHSPVTVTLINPGFIRTGIHHGALGKDGKPVGEARGGSFANVKMMSSADCAVECVRGIASRARTVVVPSYYWIMLIVYQCIPNLAESLIGKLMVKKRKSKKPEAAGDSAKSE